MFLKLLQTLYPMKMVVGTLRRLPRAGVSLILLFLSWPVCLIHGYWNNKEPNRGHWFMTEVSNPDGTRFTQDIQWYLYDTGNMISTTLIILSLYIVKQKTPSYRIALSAILLVSIIDILHYWVCYKQNHLIITLEGLIMIIASSLITFRKWNKESKSGKRL